MNDEQRSRAPSTSNVTTESMQTLHSQVSRRWRYSDYENGNSTMHPNLERLLDSCDYSSVKSDAVGLVASRRLTLARILGNDLPHRMHSRQTIDQVASMLRKEDFLASLGVTRLWLLNRLRSHRSSDSLYSILTALGESIQRIPFDQSRYQELLAEAHRAHGSPIEKMSEKDLFVDWAKPISYVTNVNQARNLLLDQHKSSDSFVAVLDGGIFIPETSLKWIIAALRNLPSHSCVIVPMARSTSIGDFDALARDEVPPLDRLGDEPQLIFGPSCEVRFDEALVYGRRTKVDLLMRLNIKGPWDDYVRHDWDQPVKQCRNETPVVGVAGWAIRYPLASADDIEARTRHASRLTSLRSLIRTDLELLKIAGEFHG